MIAGASLDCCSTNAMVIMDLIGIVGWLMLAVGAALVGISYALRKWE